ncbi:MAG: DUF2232 domain-containing protein, partial [Synergistaceae bacterium]|nr:DUF2232 domain-containing protein [Synergistaceae bacterium]
VLGLMICPLPLSVLGCLEGRKSMSAAELLIEATLFLVISPTLAAYYLLGCAPVAAVIFMLSQESFRDVKKLTGGESYVICIGTSILFKTVLIWAFWFFTGRNILFPDSAQLIDTMSQLYGNDPELMSALRQVIAVFPRLLPSMLVIFAGIETYLNYSLCYSITRKISPDTKTYPPELPAFTLWRFPVSIFFVSLAAFVLGWLIDTESDFTVTMFIMNLQIAANVIMFAEGLSLAFWIMDGFRLRRGAKTAFGVIFCIPFFWPWLIVIGMCDMTLNMRERIKFGGKE